MPAGLSSPAPLSEREGHYVKTQGFIAVAALAAASIVALAPPAMGQSRSDSAAAVSVCESERQVFSDIRERNREAIRNRVIQGVAIGILGGGALGGVATQGADSDTQRTAMIVGAVVGGIAGGVNQYIAAKQQITNDNREIARMMDADARGYAGRIQSLTGSINSTSLCRQNQIAVWEQRLIATRTEFANREAARAAALAAAPDDRTRRQLERENRRASRDDRRILDQMDEEYAMIASAIADDRELFSDVLQYFDDDIMAIALAQAQVEGTSAASLRGSAEGYTVEVVPPAILASAAASSSNFGSTSSAFGGSAPAQTAAPSVDLSDPTIYQAQIRAPAAAGAPVNGHQAALYAQRDALAVANASDQTNRARLQLALARGAQVQVPAEQ
jgi:outer membrane lipoprotein SlyB